jgi:hypothetical protein
MFQLFRHRRAIRTQASTPPARSQRWVVPDDDAVILNLFGNQLKQILGDDGHREKLTS